MDYKDLNRLIDTFQARVNDADPKKGYWKDLWLLAKEIGSSFKGCRYPSMEEKDDAWKRYQALYEKAKKRSDQAKAEAEIRKQAWEDRQARSEIARRKIESSADASLPASGFVEGLGNVILTPLLVLEGLLAKILGVDELDHVKEQLLRSSQQLRQAWRDFTDNKDVLVPSDRSKAYDTLCTAQECLDRSWSRWKEQQAHCREERKNAWEARQRERDERQAERQQSFVARTYENIAKLEEKIAKARGALYKAEENLAKLSRDYDSAWNEDFKSRCAGWIDECENRISDIKNSIANMEGWLSEARQKLR